MYENLISQIKEKEYNTTMLFSLYNKLDDDGSLIQLSNNTNEKYCVDDFEWFKFEVNDNIDNFEKYYRNFKNLIENTMDGIKKGVFVLNKDKQLFCIKLIGFDKTQF